MPSANQELAMSNTATSNIQAFSEQIEHCIMAADWAQLETLLNNRQQYLEQLFIDASQLSAQQIVDLKALAQSIQQQDTEFQLRIEQQKTSAIQQQQTLSQGRKALAAYGA